MITHAKEKNGWEFLFIGANIDAVQTAKHIGIESDRSANYCADEEGTRVLYEAVNEAVCSVRAGAPISPKWSRHLENDKKR